MEYTEHEQQDHESSLDHYHEQSLQGENAAPLAQADVDSMQGLTLDDLTRMHGQEDSSESSAETDEQQAAPSQDSIPTQAEVVQAGTDAQVENVEAEIESFEREVSDLPGVSDESSSEPAEDTPSASSDLAQHLRLELEEDSYHLAQLDDLSRFAQDAKQLFEQHLPDIMGKLSKTLHAHEQINHLYAQLEQASSQRESATVIMQTARQIESMENILATEQVPPEDVQQAHHDVQRMQRILGAYAQVLEQIQKT